MLSGIGSVAASSYPFTYEFILLFHETGALRVDFLSVDAFSLQCFFEQNRFFTTKRGASNPGKQLAKRTERSA